MLENNQDTILLIHEKTPQEPKNYKLNTIFFFHKLNFQAHSKNLKKNWPVKLPTLDFSHKVKLQNTGLFFKKLAFVVLALNLLIDKRYQIHTLKSTLFILWNTLNSYNVLF